MAFRDSAAPGRSQGSPRALPHAVTGARPCVESARTFSPRWRLGYTPRQPSLRSPIGSIAGVEDVECRRGGSLGSLRCGCHASMVSAAPAAREMGLQSLFLMRCVWVCLFYGIVRNLTAVNFE